MTSSVFFFLRPSSFSNYSKWWMLKVVLQKNEKPLNSLQEPPPLLRSPPAEQGQRQRRDGEDRRGRCRRGKDTPPPPPSLLPLCCQFENIIVGLARHPGQLLVIEALHDADDGRRGGSWGGDACLMKKVSSFSGVREREREERRNEKTKKKNKKLFTCTLDDAPVPLVILHQPTFSALDRGRDRREVLGPGGGLQCVHQSRAEPAAAEFWNDAEVEAEERGRVRDARDQPDELLALVVYIFLLLLLLLWSRNNGCLVEEGEPGREQGGRSSGRRRGSLVFVCVLVFVEKNPHAVSRLVAKSSALEPFGVAAFFAFILRKAELVDSSDLYFSFRGRDFLFEQKSITKKKKNSLF